MTDLQNFLKSLPEWQDSQRRTALYGALPLQDVNPTGWRDRVQFWKRVLIESMKRGLIDGNVTTIDVKVSDLQRKLHGDMGQLPRALPGVLEEMIRVGDIVPREKWLTSSSAWKKWFLWAVTSPLTWTMSKLSTAELSDNVNVDGVYIVAPIVRELTKSVENLVAKCVHETDRVMSLEEFQTNYTSMDKLIPDSPKHQLSNVDVQVVLSTLEAQGLVVRDEGIIKFGKDGIPPSPITSTDVGIVRIKDTTNKLSQQIQQLQDRVDELMKDVKSVVKSDPARAKRGLQMKKLIDSVLEKRQRAHLMTLDVLLKLQQAETDAEVLQAYQTASHTIRDYVSEKGLTKEVVDETMDELSNVLADQREVEEAFLQHVDTEVDEELEAELDAMMAEEVVLPNVPTVEPKLSELDELAESLENTKIAEPLT